MKRSQGGFTLIELMVVVAIIAILAAIVVPTFVREGRKAKADTEITAMFAEISTKEEAYKLEKGAYLDAPTCPSTTSTSGVNFNTTCVTSGNNWYNLRVNATDSAIRCKYTITNGAANTALTPGTPWTVPCSTGAACTTVTPATAWYYVIAECDMDGQGGTNAKFFQSSLETKYQKDGNYAK